MSTYKTKWGRSVAALMAAALVFTGLPGTEAQAAKKAKLSTKKLTVTVGKKKTIKIKNKAKKATYKFKSKKASIAKVSKKGVVTGKKKGSTKITVTEKKGKKTRKLGTVTVKVNPVKKPAASKAPIVQPTAPVVAPSTNPTQPTKAPDGPGQPTPPAQESAQPTTKAPTPPPTQKASKPPTPPPTDKPTPTPDPYAPQGEGWVKLDLSKWSGDEGSYLETGNQFILDDVELETVPLPETPAIDTKGQKVEILIRGSLAEQSSGFRFWLANSTGATLSQQYYFTEGSVGIGQDSGNTEGFNLGKPFHIQATLEHTNHDGSEDMLATTLLLKGPSYGTYLEGVTITGIWIRYGDKIGTSTEDPNVPGTVTPKPETPPVDTSNADTSTGEKPGDDKSVINIDITKNITVANWDTAKPATYEVQQDGSVKIVWPEGCDNYTFCKFNFDGMDLTGYTCEIDAEGSTATVEIHDKDKHETAWGNPYSVIPPQYGKSFPWKMDLIPSNLNDAEIKEGGTADFTNVGGVNLSKGTQTEELTLIVKSIKFVKK